MRWWRRWTATGWRSTWGPTALGNAVRHHEGADPRRPLRQAAVDDDPPGGRPVQHGSHACDLFLSLNDDQPVEWVQLHLTNGGDDHAGGRLQRDPNGGGRLQFATGVAAFVTDSGRAVEVEVVCEQAVISSLGGDSEFLLREVGAVSHRGHPALRPGTDPPFIRTSSTVTT